MSTNAEGRTARVKNPLKDSARGQLFMLLFQFLFGMAVNLIGMPSEASGAGRTATTVFLAVHVLVAIGLIVGSIRVVVFAGRLESPPTALAWVGLVVIVIAFAAGILNMMTGSGWWSYLMAASATVSLLLYGILFVRPQPSR
ncbi:MAG TPA: hypothetical protein VMV68_07880 [Spirochaetia bacterium]|nr:hypothetical protein [Spirochaetia bacterium]